LREGTDDGALGRAVEMRDGRGLGNALLGRLLARRGGGRGRGRDLLHRAWCRIDELKVRQTKSASEQREDGEQREIDGAAGGREVSVALKAQGKNSTRVQVIAKTSAVTWEKDFARAILDKIVAYTR
jgi:hypothetical protein